MPHVISVSDPYTTPGGISKSGTIALANAQLDDKAQDIPNSVGTQMIDLAEKHSTPQLEVRLGGQLIQQSERPSLSGEGIGILAAIVILLIAFGSVLAMVLPIVVALAGIAVGLPIIGLLTHVYPLQSFATTLATMIGIGVGIDYALFVVTRYRQGLQAGLDPEEAVITAIDTSGRAVLFAGLTVIIALLGMLAIGLSFISGLGIGAAAVVAVTVAGRGHAAARGARLRRHEHRQVAAAVGAQRRRRHAARRSGTAGAGFVQRHAWAADDRRARDRARARAAGAVAAARLRRRRQRSRPARRRARRTTCCRRASGPGFNGPFLLAIQLPPGGDHTAELDEAAGRDRRDARRRVGVARAHQPDGHDRGHARVPDDRRRRTRRRASCCTTCATT